MSKTTSGVYQLSNGMWGYRYAYWVDGKQKDIKRTKDENRNPFKTESGDQGKRGGYNSSTSRAAESTKAQEEKNDRGRGVRGVLREWAMR